MFYTLSLIFIVMGLVCFGLFVTEHFNDKIHNRTRWSELNTYQWTLTAGMFIGFPVGMIFIPLISYYTK